MGYVYTVHLCAFLFIVFSLTFGEARHLTERKSDAATRTFRPLSGSGVKFLGQQMEDYPVKTDNVVLQSSETSPADTFNKKLKGKGDFRENGEAPSHAHTHSPADSGRKVATDTETSSLDTNELDKTDKNNKATNEFRPSDQNTDKVPGSDIVETEDRQESEWKTLSANSEVSEISQRNHQHPLSVHEHSPGKLTSLGDLPVKETDRTMGSKEIVNSNVMSAAENYSKSKVDIHNEVPQTTDSDMVQKSFEQHAENVVSDIPTANSQILDEEPINEHGAVLNQGVGELNKHEFGLWDYPSETQQSRQTKHLNTPELLDVNNHRQQTDFEKIHRNIQQNEAEVNDLNNTEVLDDIENVAVNQGNDLQVDSSHNNAYRPRVTVFIEEKNVDNGHTRRLLTGSGNGMVKSNVVHVINESPSNSNKSNFENNVKEDTILETGNELISNTGDIIKSDPVMTALHNSKIAPPVAVLEKTHDTVLPHEHLEPVEATAASLPDLGLNDVTNDNHSNNFTTNTPEMTSAQTTTQAQTNLETEVDHSDGNLTPSTALPDVISTDRKPEDVEPLTIFTSDIKYQRFPRPMSYTTFKSKVLGKPLKKLYILEETELKLFQHVRQVQAVYTVEEDELYVSLLFRFVFSRKCQEIRKFKMGKLVGNTDLAMFEKEMKDGKTERVMFFSDRPEDYVFFMSCTDMNNSPYACRDSYYVTLDSIHDPPNQFPWGDAAHELNSKMDLTFEDPRFIFNFVLLPCARTRPSP